MAVVVEQVFSIIVGDSSPWRAHPKLVRMVNDVPYLKLPSHDPSLIRLIAHDHVELDKKTRFSLAQCDGFKALVELRNSSCQSTAADESAPGLFDVTPKKRTKLTADQCRQLRECPEVQEMLIPGVNGSPSMMVPTLLPAHPCDDIAIRLSADCLQHVIAYIQGHGVSLESLSSKRAYREPLNGETPVKGVWRNGNGSVIVKLPGTAELSDAPQAKYQRVHAARSLFSLLGAKPITDQ